MLNAIRQFLPERFFLRVWYSRLKTLLAYLKSSHPSKDLVVIGITGTDGKTSTSHFTAELLEYLGVKVALASSTELWIAGEKKVNTTKRTTLDPFVLDSFLHSAKKAGCTHAIIEVSSHALTQGRLFGIDFDIGAITNLTQEHGNYHKTLEEYAQTKAELFHLVRKSPKSKKAIIVNACIAFCDMFMSVCPEITKTYSVYTEHADLYAKNIVSNKEGSNFTMTTHSGESVEASVYVPGKYNIENILISVLTAQFVGYSLTDITKHLPKIQRVSGRLQEIKNTKGIHTYIDFALTPGALEQTLAFLQSIKTGKVFVVFGCAGGHHDHTKRPLMGQMASSLADFVILTEDENYGESNRHIMNDITKGFPEGFNNFVCIDDRKEAIFYALSQAKTGDTVLVTGMGSLLSRNDGEKEIAWSDAKCIEEFFEQM